MEHATGFPLKIGIQLPIGEKTMEGPTPRWTDIRDLACRAEAAGYDSLWFPDHLIFRHEGQEERGIWECWTLLSALAAVTERVEIGALVLCMGFRNPALLAKMADTADEISNGRIILGLGAGWHEPEYRAFGFPFDHRFKRFEEGLKIIHGLLRDGRADVAGTYSQANDAVLRPRGPRQSGPPIMIGTTGERMLRLTARYADAWNVFPSRTGNTIERLLPILRRVDAACEAVGRDPATLERTCAVFIGLPGQPDPGDSPQPLITGSAEELAESLRAFVEVGISHIQFVLNPMTPDSIDAFAPVLELLRRG